MARINILLNDKLIDEIKREAKQEGRNPSTLIHLALERYIADTRCACEEQEKRRKMEEASRKMDALAKKLGDWDPDAAIRKFRDTTYNPYA